MAMWQKILIGMVLGVAAGFLFREQAYWLKPFGTLFINMVKMLIVPLILLSVMSAILSLKQTEVLGRLGAAYMVGLVLTCLLAAAIGIGSAQALKPGLGLGPLLAESTEPAPVATDAMPAPGYDTLIASLAPENIVAAMAEGNTIQLLFFALFLGLAIRSAGEKGAIVASWVESMTHVTYRLTAIILWFSPFGIFALMAWMVASQDLLVLESLGKLVLAMYGSAVLMVMMYGLLLIPTGISLGRFLRDTASTILFAASSTSSAATLPLTLKSGEALGLRPAIANFVLPLGVSTNMHGTVLKLSIVTLFVAQGANIDLSIAQYGMLLLFCLFASFATAGVPNAGVIVLPFVLSVIGLPIGAVALIIGVYRLLDMAITPLNVLGDLVLAALLDRYTPRSSESLS